MASSDTVYIARITSAEAGHRVDPVRTILLTAVLATLPASGVRALREGCADPRPWQQLVLAHQRRYPGLEVGDALKLLQQATMGSEHWVREGEAAAWMRREWAALGDGPDEPLADTLGPDGRYARVHLRPYRAAGGDPDVLVRVFVESAAAAAADTAALRCALDALAGLARRGDAPWPADRVDSAITAWADAGYPAVHHSAAFRQRHRPAYRVVAVTLVPLALPGAARAPRWFRP